MFFDVLMCFFVHLCIIKSNGLLIQWKQHTGNTGNGEHNFPIDFPTTCASIVVGQSNKNEVTRVMSLSKSKYKLDCAGGSPITVFVTAIGY